MEGRSLYIIVPAFLLFAQFGWRYVVRYRLADEDLRVMILGAVPVRVAGYHRIEEVRGFRFPDLSPPLKVCS